MKINTDSAILYDDVYIFEENNIVVKNNLLPEKKEIELICREGEWKDFFSEPDLNYSAFMLKEASLLPAGFNYIPLRQFFFDFPEKKPAAPKFAKVKNIPTKSTKKPKAKAAAKKK